MKLYRWARSWATMKRGRAMFSDCVSGKMVHEYTDCYGVRWMADSRWGFRVECV